MISHLPIRLRLMLWYSAFLAAGLLAFSGVVWLGMREGLRGFRERLVEDQVHALSAFIRHEVAQGLSTAALREELDEFSQALPQDFSVRVVDASGSEIYTRGPSPGARTITRAARLSGIEEGWQIEISASMADVDDTLARLARILSFSLPLVLLLAGAGGYWISGHAMSPIVTMANAAQAIGPNDVSARLPVPQANDELRRLAEMWNGMLGRLDDGVRRIRQFTADASHDLRTPISSIQATAEVALRKTRSEKEYRQALTRIIAQTDRATTLVEDLLALARTDSHRAGLDMERVELNGLVEKAADSLQALALARGLSFRVSVSSNPIQAISNAAAITRLVTILADNAVQNTDSGTIEILAKSVDNTFLLTVTDSGSGIPAEDLPHIFDRFYRGNKSRNGSRGHGLGLSIAKWIVEAHQGTIQVTSRVRVGTTFMVRLPVIQPALDGAGPGPAATT